MSTLLGRKILQRRLELGLTQEQLASMMGYKSKSSINKIEMGLNDIYQSKIYEFSKVLNVPVGYFFREDDTYYEYLPYLAQATPEKIEIIRSILKMPELKKDISTCGKMVN